MADFALSLAGSSRGGGENGAAVHEIDTNLGKTA
jgi:hypothetical protein